MMIRAIQSDFMQLLELPSAILCNQRLYRETYLAEQTLGHTQFRSFTTFFVVSESAWQRNSFFCMKSSPWLRRCKRIQHILSFSTPWHWPLLIFILQQKVDNRKLGNWMKRPVAACANAFMMIWPLTKNLKMRGSTRVGRRQLSSRPSQTRHA